MAQENRVSFNNILVNTMGSNSGIFVGTNSQVNWNTNNNNKSGFGSVFGMRNVISRSFNIFMDNDMIDTPIITNNHYDNPLSAVKGKDNITIYGCRRSKIPHAE